MELLFDGGRNEDQIEHGNARALFRALRADSIPPVLVSYRIFLGMDSQRDAGDGEEEVRRYGRAIAAFSCRSTSLRDGPAAARSCSFAALDGTSKLMP
jgi:hypothetical protein